MGKEAIESVLEHRNQEKQYNNMDLSYSPERAEMTAHESQPETHWRTESNGSQLTMHAN